MYPPTNTANDSIQINFVIVYPCHINLTIPKKPNKNKYPKATDKQNTFFGQTNFKPAAHRWQQ